MNLTGNELQQIFPNYFQQIHDNFLKKVASTPNALKSVIFSTAQIRACQSSHAVGVGLIRINHASLTKAQTLFTQLTNSTLAMVSVDNTGTIISANGGIAALATCPPVYCPQPVQLQFDALWHTQKQIISKMTIAEVTANKVVNDPINLGSIYFGNTAVNSILAQPKCVGIMVLLVEYPNLSNALAICGIDQNYKEQLGNKQLIAYSDIPI